MQHTLSIPARQTLTTVLVVCISVCCCQGQLLIEGLSGPDAITAAEAGCASAGCCAKPAEPQDAPKSPTRRCQSCCVKGTGLKATSLTLPAPTVVFVHVHDPAPLIATPPSVGSRRPLEVTVCVDPPTLLRLHCALVV